jgi:AdoMet-dependent heme synthase
MKREESDETVTTLSCLDVVSLRDSVGRMIQAKHSLKYTRQDVHHSPFVVFYELTQACDLVCKHCRACAQPARAPDELDSHQARRLLDQLASFPKPPMLVLTGGDPLKRPDVYDLVEYGVGLKLDVAMTPSATPLVTVEALGRLQAAGLHRLALSLDGADAATHDAFRGVPGSFARTLAILADARRIGLPLQVNTTVTALNVHQIDTLAELLADLGIVLWSVFFLVPVGRGEQLQRISPEQYEEVFERLWHHAQRRPYGIKTTEAPQYRRFVLQRQGNPQRNPEDAVPGGRPRAPLGINDGRGVMFVSHQGAIYPSGFLPIVCGRFPGDSVVAVYQHHHNFQALRDLNRLEGKCGYCEFRHICGGSRARSFALTGDMLASEPDCPYQPSVLYNQTDTGK